MYRCFDLLFVFLKHLSSGLLNSFVLHCIFFSNCAYVVQLKKNKEPISDELIRFTLVLYTLSTFLNKYLFRCTYFQRLLKLNIKTLKALFVRALSGLRALVHEKETRNFTSPRTDVKFLVSHS